MTPMLAAVVPTVDEAETIGGLVRALDKFCDRVIVSDGSCNNRTAQTAYEAGGFLIDGLGGIGPAYQRAWGIVPKDWYVAHIDAGGSHDPQDLALMADICHDYDVVIGSRFGVDGEHHGSWHRRFTSRMASWALNLVTLADYEDWTSGLRIYSPHARDVLERHVFTTSGHAWQIESLFVCRQHNLKIIECPITYMPSPSHLSAGRVTEAARLWWRMLWA